VWSSSMWRSSVWNSSLWSSSLRSSEALHFEAPQCEAPHYELSIMKVSSSRYFFLNSNIVLRRDVAGGGASTAVAPCSSVKRATKWAENKYCI
jgi:hypothetical protein